MVGFVPELPVPLLVRRDWPGFPAPKMKGQSCQRCGRARTPRVALMAQEDEEVVDTKGESSAPAANTIHHPCLNRSCKRKTGNKSRMIP